MRIKKGKGSLVLTEPCHPAFRTGTYTLSASIGARIKGETRQSDIAEQMFTISGLRFTLEEGTVDSVYPADGELCCRKNTLPHIVLNRATQPFECSVNDMDEDEADSGISQKEPPYMALLLFYEEEMPKLQYGLVGQMLKEHPSEVLIPFTHCTAEEEKSSCCFMDIPLDLLKGIAPKLDELWMLVHGRKTDPLLKCMPKGDALINEIKAVVVGNRIPKYGVGNQPVRNHACLVSLAGCKELLQKESRPWENGFDEVRIAVMHHWEFTALEDKDVDVGLEDVSARGIGLPLRTTDCEAEKLTENGYILLPHRFREGSHCASLYRGPLVQDIRTAEKDRFVSSDALYRYDPEWGVFDVSYACAWQLGKLLVLARESIAKKILFARTSARKEICGHMLQEMLLQEGVHAGDAEGKKGIENQVLELLEQCFGDEG